MEEAKVLPDIFLIVAPAIGQLYVCICHVHIKSVPRVCFMLIFIIIQKSEFFNFYYCSYVLFISSET